MRRTLVTLLALTLLLGLPFVATAQGPGPFGPFGPGGVIQQSFPSTAVTTPQITVSPGTGSAQTVLSVTLNASVFTSGYPIHFLAHARLSSLGGSPGTMNQTMTLGTGTALTFMSLYTLTSALSNIPMTIECVGGPLNLATDSGAQYSLSCSASWVEVAGTPKQTSGTAVVKYNATSRLPSTIAAVWALTFSSSANGNGLVVDDWKWSVN